MKNWNWNKILGTGVDAASYVMSPVGVPLQAISYGTTGKSLGENITGESVSTDVQDKVFGGGKTGDAADALLNNQSLSALQQDIEAQNL